MPIYDPSQELAQRALQMLSQRAPYSLGVNPSLEGPAENPFGYVSRDPAIEMFNSPVMKARQAVLEDQTKQVAGARGKFQSEEPLTKQQKAYLYKYLGDPQLKDHAKSSAMEEFQSGDYWRLRQRLSDHFDDFPFQDFQGPAKDRKPSQKLDAFYKAKDHAWTGD